MDNFTPYAVIPNKDKWAENAFKSAQNLLSRGYNDMPTEEVRQVPSTYTPVRQDIGPNMDQSNQADIETYAIETPVITYQVNENPVAPKSNINEDINKIAFIESRGKHFTNSGNLTTSGKGALGKFQLMPETAAQPGYGVKPIPDLTKATEAEHQLFATEYYSAMLNKFDGDKEKALAAYNGGPGMVEKAIKKDPVNWKKHIPKESLNYIKQFQAL